MMKVTKTTFSMIVKNRYEANKKVAMLQKKLKSGKWGKPVSYEMFSGEKNSEDVLARIEKLNPGYEWRVAEEA